MVSMLATLTAAGAATGGQPKGTGKGLILDGRVSFKPLLPTYRLTDRGLLLQANWEA